MDNNSKAFKIFVDFDGTITKQDVGEEMFFRFGDVGTTKNIIQDWIDEKISSTQLWIKMYKTVENFSRDAFEDFLDEMEIDPTFPSFVEFCDENKLQITVVSDGFDYYINNLLRKNGLGDLKIYSNKLEINRSSLTPFFPYSDEECKLCANCKRNHIISNSGDEDITVYIGDGFSDKCPAQYTDFIFAKKALLKFCEVNRISYYPFSNFNDVKKRIGELLLKKRVKKRHQAELKRKAVYAQG